MSPIGSHLHQTAIDEALHWQDIGHLIMSTQRRCSTGVAKDPLALAKRAMAIITVARSLRVTAVKQHSLPLVYWETQLWEPGLEAGKLATVVFITEHWVCTSRTVIDPDWHNGELMFIVSEAS